VSGLEQWSTTARWEEPVSRTKPFAISKWAVWEAYRRVKANKGVGGVDGVSMTQFEQDLKGNLYKLWNRMSSGCYFPPPVRLVEIPKRGGGVRPLGVPTVADRIAQTVVAMELEKTAEPIFHADSYGYRPGRSALDAVEVCRKRCWKSDWVVDLDIKSFFDSLDHQLLMKAVAHHTDQRWVLLYVQRWLEAPLQGQDGTLVERDRGTPQGSAISPLLANLYLHYAFDAWMGRAFPLIQFERYADDVVVHCNSEVQARRVRDAIAARMVECGLQLHPDKTKIVYCKDSNRNGSHEHEQFDFLSYTFRPRRVKSRTGAFFVSFAPAVSNDAAKRMRREVKRWRVHLWVTKTLRDLAQFVNPIVQGWINYYGRFYKSWLIVVFKRLNDYLVRWAMRKYKRLKRSWRRGRRFLADVARRDPGLFAHWRHGFKPSGWTLGAG
jgi:RNA-directed DNA polymerase